MSYYTVHATAILHYLLHSRKIRKGNALKLNTSIFSQLRLNLRELSCDKLLCIFLEGYSSLAIDGHNLRTTPFLTANNILINSIYQICEPSSLKNFCISWHKTQLWIQQVKTLTFNFHNFIWRKFSYWMTTWEKSWIKKAVSTKKNSHVLQAMPYWISVDSISL